MISKPHTIYRWDSRTIYIDMRSYWAAWLIEGDDPNDTTKELTLIQINSAIKGMQAGGLRGAHIIDITPKILKLIRKHINVLDDPFAFQTNKHGITMVTLPCPYEEEV